MKLVRSVAILLALMVLFTITGCKHKSSDAKLKSINASATYEHLIGGQDIRLYKNPDRGLRTDLTLLFKPTLDGTEADFRTMGIDDGYDENIRKIDKIFTIYFPGTMECKSKLVLVYVMFHGFNKGDIPDEVFDLIDYAFDKCRLIKVKVLFRYGYHQTLLTNDGSQEDREALAKVCADETTMLKHIDQLAVFLEKNRDVIHTITAGAIGFAGEQRVEYQYPPVDFNTVVKALIEKICVPNGFQYTFRNPQHKIDLLEEYPDYEYAYLIGFVNDAVYGEQDKKGWHSYTGMQWHSDNGLWDYVVQNAAYTSQSGELLPNKYYLSQEKNFPVTGIEAAAQIAHHRYTTFSQWHTLYENYGDDNLVARWIENETITPEMLDSKGLIYDPEWFYNENGNLMFRNPYEYIRDYLGYRITAESADISGELGAGGKLEIDLKIKNYGFAAAFFLESGFAILNDKYEVVSSVKAGEPDKWISLPADYFVEDKTLSVINDIIEYTVSAELDSPSESGRYYIAFYLKNNMNDFATLANDYDSIDFIGDGYNVLFTLEL